MMMMIVTKANNNDDRDDNQDIKFSSIEVPGNDSRFGDILQMKTLESSFGPILPMENALEPFIDKNVYADLSQNKRLTVAITQDLR